MFVPIHIRCIDNQTKLSMFEKVHSGHPIQTINLYEIPEGYTCVSIKVGKEREEILNDIREMLRNKISITSA